MNTKCELITDKYLIVLSCGNNFATMVNKRQLPASFKIIAQLNVFKHRYFAGVEDYL